ncbi:MAG TPA: class I SAM-dependent methyltransferase [Myxococcota bacterium]|nr:class I SAM-dependent methyltransferase [Myxococcota bacterium]
MLTVDLDRLGLEPGDWLLDAGCGGGRHCFGALDRGVHSVGLDLDVPSLRIARAGIHERRGRAVEKLHGGVLRGDVFGLPFRDGSFDRAICSEVMEHVHDYGAAARELARVLRPGGTLAVTIPTAITEWLYLAATRRYFESPGGHIRVFRPRDLARALARAGLRVDGVGFAHAFHSPYWGVRALVGLDDEAAPPTRAFRAFLVRAAFSRSWSRVERLFDRVWPKSLVLYGTRVASGRLPEPPCA